MKLTVFLVLLCFTLAASALPEADKADYEVEAIGARAMARRLTAVQSFRLNLDKFRVAWNPQNFQKKSSREVWAVYNTRGTSPYQGGTTGKYDTEYGYGEFSCDLQTPPGNVSGIITGFYLYTEKINNVWNEIDFEFVGMKRRMVWTNCIGDQGSINNWDNPRNNMPFDHSVGWHNYRIVYKKNSVEWYVDGTLIRSLSNATANKPMPYRRMHVEITSWSTENSLPTSGLVYWAGQFNGRDSPYNFKVKNLRAKIY